MNRKRFDVLAFVIFAALSVSLAPVTVWAQDDDMTFDEEEANSDDMTFDEEDATSDNPDEESTSFEVDSVKGNKLAIVTNDRDVKKYEGCNILIFDMWMGCVQKKTTSTSPPTESCWPAEVPR